MSLLWLEGFDGAADMALRYPGGAEWQSATGRYGVGAARTPQGTPKLMLPASSKLFVGMAVQRNGGSGLLAFFGDSGTTQHLTLSSTDATNGQLTLYRGAHGGTSLATASVPKIGAINQWIYLEVSATIADSGGTCEVKVDGTTVINFTGDTKNAGTATTIDAVAIFNTAMWYDDWYILDDVDSGISGNPLNTFLGERRVHTSLPSAAGSSTGWTPDSGSNFARVNEQPYSATSNVQTNAAVAGTRDMYTIADLPSNATSVTAVAVTVIAKKSDAGAASIKPSVRSGGTNYDGSTIALTPSDLTYQQRWSADPATGAAWTVSAVNAMEAGVVTA